MCGEHLVFLYHAAYSVGSSPRVRGTPKRYYWAGIILRFIPACAGNTCWGTTRIRCAPGSSPRVRGTRPRPHRDGRKRRFIPACAGNTCSCARRLPTCPVHPRVCGEHEGGDRSRGNLGGSSPRVRGTQSRSDARSPQRRFIPACAGNTNARTLQRQLKPVHPRVCGEHVSFGRCSVRLRGSSPRVRGTPAERPHPLDRLRFIPACAGNTSSARLISATISVHPRVCGEHRNVANAAGDTYGSSPRVRGTRRRRASVDRRRRFIPRVRGTRRGRRCPHQYRRFIPACAGNTHHTVLAQRCQYGSSPRVRGTPLAHRRESLVDRFIPACAGNTHATIGPASFSGSSPRVRGTPLGLLPARYGRRFIPACAGNTERRSFRLTTLTVHPRVCGEHFIATCA